MKYLLTTLFIIFAGCEDHSAGPLKEKIKELESKASPFSPDAEQLSRDRLEGFKYQRSRWKKKKDFFVLERYGHFELNKCQDCHGGSKPLPSKAKNHDEIILNHAKDLLNCNSCHQEKETWKLQNLRGKEVSINHAYQVCAQCHNQQAEDWAGGAHGKRIGGWEGKRVIKNCADCHNPHNPAFGKRMPKTTPHFLKYKK